MSEKQGVTAAVIIIGNEILSGRTRDANLPFLGERLDGIGIRLQEARVVPDRDEAILRAVDDCRSVYDYVFTTGGIGPTHDDITAASIARAFGVPFGRNAAAEAILRSYYAPGDATPARMRMADMPEGVTLIDNPVSAAPGFQIGNVFVLPGVPSIMRAMFDGLTHRLQGGDPVLSETVVAFLAEGVIGEPLRALQADFAEVDIGSYPFFRAGRLGTSLVLRSTDAGRLEAAAEALRDLVRELGSEPVDKES